MFKKVLAMLLVLTLAIGLAACGQEPAAKEEATEQPSEPAKEEAKDEGKAEIGR
ncbi:MAG: hypothetical protein MJA82_08250 [Clostridia bacterium]|nr:hypothetical protein [Clostridia bacterium]